MMGKVDLAAGILELAMDETSAQSLRKKMDIAPKTLEDQLQMLKSKKLVDSTNDGKAIRTTKRGTQFLELYRSIHARYLTIQA
jgi:predicted transcriptional regulator